MNSEGKLLALFDQDYFLLSLPSVKKVSLMNDARFPEAPPYISLEFNHLELRMWKDISIEQENNASLQEQETSHYFYVCATSC